jgi:hypothetical protein
VRHWSKPSLHLLVIFLATLECPKAHAVGIEATCSYTDIHPTYPPPNAPPSVQVKELADGAVPPTGGACFANANRAATWITVSSVVRAPLSPDELIKRFGAISKLPGVLYWSTTDQAWRPMVSAAMAVDSAGSAEARADYSIDELAAGISHYYRVTDTRTYDSINYRLRMWASPAGQILVETANVDSIKKWGITLYKADGLHTLYYLNERSAGRWSYYSITRAVPATFLAKGHDKSYVNRAIALFRHYMGMPVTGEPPAAR